MEKIMLYEMTELYKILDGVKNPDARTKAARDKIFDLLLTYAEQLRRHKSVPVE
jgi:hypothetical protein